MRCLELHVSRHGHGGLLEAVGDKVFKSHARYVIVVIIVQGSQVMCTSAV